MMASINAGVADVPGMTDEASRYFRDLYDHLIRLADLVDSYRDLSEQRDGHPPLDRVEPPQRRDEAADDHRDDLLAAELPDRLLRAELRLHGAGLAGADVELLRARHRPRAGRRRVPGLASSGGGAGWGDRRSEGVRRRVARGGWAGASGRSPVCASYSVHQASQPSGTGKPSCLRRSTRSRTRSFCSRTSASVPGSLSVALVRSAAQSDSSRRQASRRASMSSWVPAATSASRSGSRLGQQVGRPQPAVVLVDAEQAGLDLEEADHVDDRVDHREGRPGGQRGTPRLEIWRSATPIMPMERSPM